MNPCLIHRAQVVNEGREYKASVLLENGIISEVFEGDVPSGILSGVKIIDAQGLHLFPGVIDDQVHFREPGLTHKGDIASESRAAVAGGVTSFMDMPNTLPQTLTVELLEKKFKRASEVSPANYSFYMGASNDNLSELKRIDPGITCGIKVFMGSSTGDMLVDDPEALARIFSLKNILIATHCEDEQIIRHNAELYRMLFGEDVPVRYHPSIRSEEACFKSTRLAVDLARKHGTRLHILHLSTARELNLLDPSPASEDKRITAEACVHHLWFSQDDYDRLGSKIKWNPAIKTSYDRQALINGLTNNLIDVVATDHAPHTLAEKENPYFTCPSGGPLVQHSLLMMIELSKKGFFPLTTITEKMAHAPARLFGIDRRGFIRKGYFADLVLVNLNKPHHVTLDTLLYKCKWSPLEGVRFGSSVTHTFVNGNLVYDGKEVNDAYRGMPLRFKR
ncbi:MAG: dihydroorotase [Bacteroidales bacterium]